MKWQNNFVGASAKRIWQCGLEFITKSSFLGLGIGIATIIASLGSSSAAFAEGLTLTIPDTLSFNVTPDLASSAGTFGKSEGSSLSAQTTTAFGYTLSLKLKNDANSNKLMNGSHFLTSIGSAMTEEQFKSTAAANTWGYLPSKLNKAANTSYQPGPTTNTVLDETDAANAGATPYSIGLAAKVNSEAAPGAYSNTFEVTLIANAVNYTVKYDLNGEGATGGPSAPITGSSVEQTASVQVGSEVPTRDGYEFKGWCTDKTSDENCTGTTVEAGKTLTLNSLKKGNDNTVTLYAMWKMSGPPTTMQNFEDYCISMSTGQTIKLRDIRDDAEYTVAKLKDGKCWMTQNLRIGSNDEKTLLTPENSDIDNDFTLPQGTTKIAASASDATGWHENQHNTAHIYINSNNNYGGYYTWFAATAGEGKDTISTNGANTTHSICPKGWTLPTKTQFDTFVSKYKSTYTSNPPNFGSTVWAGTCSQYGCPYYAGSSGSLWSSTAYGSGYTYNLSAGSVGLIVDANHLNYYGHFYTGEGISVRCVTRAVTNYTIYYDVSGGGGDCNIYNVPETKIVELTEDNAVLDGQDLSACSYDFKGWCTVKPANNSTKSPSCNGQTYQPGQSMLLYKEDPTITLYAIWQSSGGLCGPCPL